jgi:hypothetical protein
VHKLDWFRYLRKQLQEPLALGLPKILAWPQNSLRYLTKWSPNIIQLPA